LLSTGSRNGYERDFTLRYIEDLMEDWLKCQISPLVKYRQNQNQKIPINLYLYHTNQLVSTDWRLRGASNWSANWETESHPGPAEKHTRS